MPGERIQRRIDALFDEAAAAATEQSRAVLARMGLEGEHATCAVGWA